MWGEINENGQREKALKMEKRKRKRKADKTEKKGKLSLIPFVCCSLHIMTRALDSEDIKYVEAG